MIEISTGFNIIFFIILAFRQIYLADFILLFHVKENLKDVFSRALIRFCFRDSRLKLPLLFNESISGHLYVKDFSVSLPFATLSCGLRLSSITNNFYSLTKNMGTVLQLSLTIVFIVP